MANKSLKDLSNKFGIKIGYYDDSDNLSEERIVPLGNYISDPFPTKDELMITRLLSSSLKKSN